MSENNEENAPKKKYLTNKNLMYELEKSKEQGYMTDELGKMFMLLAERYTSHRFFVRYPPGFKEELVSTGVLACCKAWESFDPSRQTHPNPFAFFTTCVHNAFVQLCKKEYNQKNIVNALKVDEGMNPDHGYQEIIDEKDEKEKRDKENSEEEQENEKEKVFQEQESDVKEYKEEDEINEVVDQNPQEIRSIFGEEEVFDEPKIEEEPEDDGENE